MSKFICIAMLLFLTTVEKGMAQSKPDSNIVISNAIEQYRFDYNRKKNEVEVLQKATTTYQCNQFRVTIPVIEFYDDKTTIDEVKIYVDGDKAKYIKPEYSYYSIEDVFYSDARICYFNLPLEKKGSSSEVTFEKTLTDPRYFTTLYFTDGYTVQQKEVKLTIPRWMKIEMKEMNFAGFQIQKKLEYNAGEDADVITYTVKQLPARKSEAHGPGPSYIQPHLLFQVKEAVLPDNRITYFKTLDDQYAWYRAMIKTLQNNTAVVKDRALKITEGITDPQEQIKAILYWMYNNIRYIAFEDGIAGYKPEKADEVLRKKYGDCKGMANLTKEMLRSLGFDARLCWIGTNHIAYDYSTPSIAVDNHMICALLWKGKTYFLDATESYLTFNEYAERIQGRQVLIEDGDKYIFTKVPNTSFQQNKDEEKAILKITGNDLEGTVQREWIGEEKQNIIVQLNNMKKENSTNAFTKYLSDDNSNYQMTNLRLPSLDNYDKTLKVAYNLTHKNASSSFGKEIYVDIDYRKEFNNFIFDVKERNNDYWFSYKYNIVRDLQLQIPTGYQVTAVPANVSIKNSDYEIDVVITQQPGKILYKKTIVIKNPRLSKSKFEQWNADINKLKAFYNEQIVLTQK